MCFEVEGAEIARRFLERRGMSPEDADRVAIAIILHMQPSVTTGDGVEAVLLDRATSLDVRGDGYSLVDAVRSGVMGDFPRRAFDRRFLDAITREAALRPGMPGRAPAAPDRARGLDGPIALGDRGRSLGEGVRGHARARQPTPVLTRPAPLSARANQSPKTSYPTGADPTLPHRVACQCGPSPLARPARLPNRRPLDRRAEETGGKHSVPRLLHSRILLLLTVLGLVMSMTAPAALAVSSRCGRARHRGGGRAPRQPAGSPDETRRRSSRSWRWMQS